MTSTFTKLMALGIIAALAVVAAVTVRAIEANTSPNTPRAGDVDDRTSCTWVKNSYTVLYAVIADYGLLPPDTVKNSILNGIPEDDVTHHFMWYWNGEPQQGIGQDALDLYTQHYQSQNRTVNRQFNNGAYYIHYTGGGGGDPVHEKIVLGTMGLQMWHENGRYFSQIETDTGNQWAYVRTTAGPFKQQTLLSLGCWHILPDSTPSGHEAFIEED